MDRPYYVLVECDTIEDLRKVRRAIHASDATERDMPFRPDREYDAYGRPSRWAVAKHLFDLIRVPHG
jgi:hypothetical protein